MRPIHVFLILIFLGLIALAVWFWINRDGPPAEIEIAMDPKIEAKLDSPDRQTDSSDVVAEPDGEPDLRDFFEPDDCRWLTRHIPDADVAYKPGVDVRGEPVVPADLGGGYDLELPKTVVASVSRRLLRHPNLRQETAFAEIEIDVETGAIWINGKGLDTPEHDGLVAWCRDRNR